MLTVKNINQYYGGSHILRDVSLEAHLGQVTVLLGRNGVGKTTLLKSLMGLVPIKTGSIEFEGKAIHSATPYQRARAGIGFVPQGREIFARLTVEENLRMGLAYKSAGNADSRRAVRAVPGAQADAGPAWRRPLGRPAAATGHRARAGGQAQAADPGRAHRRHPAQHHQGHRPRDPHAGRPRRHGDPAGGAVLRLRAANWRTTTW